MQPDGKAGLLQFVGGERHRRDQQIFLVLSIVPCPRLWMSGGGLVLAFLKDNLLFMILVFDHVGLFS